MKLVLEIIGGVVLLVAVYVGAKRLAEIIGKGVGANARKREGDHHG